MLSKRLLPLGSLARPIEERKAAYASLSANLKSILGKLNFAFLFLFHLFFKNRDKPRKRNIRNSLFQQTECYLTKA